MRLQPLRMRRITWPMRRGQIFPTYLKSLTRFTIHYTTFMALRLRQMELSAKTMYGPVLKTTQLSVHAQITSALNVAVNLLPSSFSATTISRESLQILVMWQHLGQFLAIFSLRMRRNGYLWTPVKILTSPFDSLTPISLQSTIFPRFDGRFLLIFALDKLNVRHIPTSGLVDLLT